MERVLRPEVSAWLRSRAEVALDELDRAGALCDVRFRDIDKHQYPEADERMRDRVRAGLSLRLS